MKGGNMWTRLRLRPGTMGFNEAALHEGRKLAWLTRFPAFGPGFNEAALHEGRK